MSNKRVSAIRNKLMELNLDGLLIGSAVNRRYVSGFTGSAGMVLLTAADGWLVTDFRYGTQAAQQARGFTVIEHGIRAIDTIAELAAAAGIKRLGFEQDHVVFGEYANWQQSLSGLELVPTSSIVEQIRMFKDEDELAVMREAAALADETFSHILAYIKPGVRERDIALEMEMFMRSRGATSSSFETIVASGERSALPHGVASDRIIGSDEFVKLDFGAYMNGYCSDLTRTVVVGSPSDRHREIYDIVLEAQLTTLSGIKPGMTGREADALARDVITRYGYGDRFGHGTGHGLGMEIHEAPRLSKTGDIVLQPGMTVTVEPGIYLPGFGGVRIEDDIVITESGISLLTASSKELQRI
ncbi:M24 family metallopeptidase [Paenibacillus spongiae]|uniref:Xaa-Pro peptidase family protein n=1 Tax=Paenibacillus spongiae TaxID=2909671 RepID=A0ABY5SHW0_9BACL|nr:Xaa-Pro peptidase family protein [Paenibacillus spongiae]UVI32275.1 Xaa-Pro peptidase family protein [Paenibacillus spongiae]